SSVKLNAVIGDTARWQLVGVVSTDRSAVSGLSASVLSYAAGPNGSACTTANWILTPISFDVTNANPAAILTVRGTALNLLGVYSCTATIRVQSTTPAYQQDFDVTIDVSRAPVFQTGLQVIVKPDTMKMMG